jgi:hypothetical protein
MLEVFYEIVATVAALKFRRKVNWYVLQKKFDKTEIPEDSKQLTETSRD